MPPPIALQLYSVRDILPKDPKGVIRKIAEMGYIGVETAGLPGMSLAESAKFYKEVGLMVSSAHSSPPIGDKKNEVLDFAKTLGIKRLVGGRGPDDFKTVEKIRATCEGFNVASRACRENGLEYAIHNHWWEFITLDGKPVYKYMLEYLEPHVQFQIDVYWVQTGGCNPAAVLKEVGKRATLLHIKDGPCEREKVMTAVGDGKVDMGAISKVAQADWWIVELDRCDTDMMEAVHKSYKFLTSKGYTRGKR